MRASSRIGRYENPFLTFQFTGDLPAGASVRNHLVETADRAATQGFLYRPKGRRPRTVVTFMHPRADFMRHYAVPGLLAHGYAVWTQNSRWVGNDTMLLHERVLLDVAAGITHLRDLGFEHVVVCGNSGGGSLYSFYVSEAHAPSGMRLTETASGDPLDLNQFAMPAVDGLVWLAAHPGEGHFLLHAIDPSVADESDPLSCDSSLDLYDPANGFRPPPEPSHYTDEFLRHYRGAQRARVERLDLRAREMIARRKEARKRARAGDAQALRASIAVPIMTVYRTAADPRTVDLRLDPSNRDYGDLFSFRPDLFNWGPVGFGRVVTPDAWLSTWSGLSSFAEVDRTAPKVDVPALVLSYSGDNATFPSDTTRMFDALASPDKLLGELAGDHYGHPLPGRRTPGRDVAVRRICRWLDERFGS